MPALLAGAVVLSPFLGKAFTNDDVTFLLQAKHLIADPLHPTAFEGVFDGERLRLSQALVTGPVMAYLLVPTIMLGGAEWVAHMLQLGLLAVAVVATVALAFWRGLQPPHATVAGLLVVVSPAVLGMAATAMPDIAAMAFGVAGVERLLAWRVSRSLGAGGLAAVLLALAVLSRPHLILLLPCASLWLVCGGAPRGMRLSDPIRASLGLLMPVGLALLLVCVAIYITRDPASGETIAGAIARRTHPHTVALNLGSFAFHWTVAFPLVALWLPYRWRDCTSLRGLLGVVLGLSLALLGGFFAEGAWWWWIPVLGVALATVVLMDIVGVAWDQRDPVSVALSLWLFIGAAAAWYDQLPAKLLVPSVPAMAVLLAGHFSWTRGANRSLYLFGSIAVAGVVLGVLIIRADARMADVGREGGRIVAEHLAVPARPAGRVWADGAWGFQWYAMEAGAEVIARTPPFPEVGDLIVAGLRPKGPPGVVRSVTRLSHTVYATPGGRVHGEGAGFFNNRVGPWPWMWGCGEVGRIEVWRVDSVASLP